MTSCRELRCYVVPVAGGVDANAFPLGHGVIEDRQHVLPRTAYIAELLSSEVKSAFGASRLRAALPRRPRRRAVDPDPDS